MVESTGQTAQDQELEIAHAQCLIAFGRGAGNLDISADAVRQLLRFYRPIIAHHWPNWAKESGSMLGMAEAIGRLAAHVAVDAGNLLIEPDSVSAATRRIMIPCLAPIARGRLRRKS